MSVRISTKPSSLFAQLDLFKVLTDLSQSHRGVTKDFLPVYLLVQDLCEDHLKGHGYTRALEVLLEHLSLLLLLLLPVVNLGHHLLIGIIVSRGSWFGFTRRRLLLFRGLIFLWLLLF